MEVQIIHDRSPDQAIYQVADGTAEEQAIPPPFPPVRHAFEQYDGQPHRDDQGEGNEDIALPTAGIREKTEGCAAIQDVDEIEKR